VSYHDDPKPPPAKCPGCGRTLQCPDCDDTRPEADDLYDGWLLRSPLERIETVTSVKREGEYGPVLVYTKEAGKRPWRYYRSEKVTAVPPLGTFHGTPELRAIEYSWRDGPMYVVATLDTIYRPDADSAKIMVESRYAKMRDDQGNRGWYVSYRPTGAGDVVTTWHDSKAKARTAARAAGREVAKQLRVPFRIQEARP
jgi:hypothetical protein